MSGTNETTVSDNGIGLSSDVTTLSQNITNITSNFNNSNETSKTFNSTESFGEIIQDNSNNSLKGNVSDQFYSALYNPWLNVFDGIQLIGCVIIIIIIFKANKCKDIPSRLLFNNILTETCIGISFLIILNIPMLITSDNMPMQTVLFVQKFIFILMKAEGTHTFMIMLYTLHLAVCYPIYYKIHCRTRYFVIFLVISWTFNITHSCCIFFVEFRDMDELSNILWLYATRFYLPATILYIIVTDVLPFLVITVVFIKIKIHIIRGNQVCINQSASRNYIRQAKVIFILACAVILTSFTSDALDLVMAQLPDFELQDKLYLAMNVFQIVGYMFVVLKLPLLLYGFKSYRRVLLSMLCCNGSTSRHQRSQNIATVEFGKNIPKVNGGVSSCDSGLGTSGT